MKDHYLRAFKISSNDGGKNGRNIKPKIFSICVYPIKSCAPIKPIPQIWPLDSASLLYDRSFVIMQGRRCLTQKVEPRLCMIRPAINLANKTMVMSMTGLPDFVLNLGEYGNENVSSMETCFGKVCGDAVEGTDCGKEVSEWLETALGLSDLNLVKLLNRRQKKAHSRSKAQNKLKSFANEGQFLILNLNSAIALEENRPNSYKGDETKESKPKDDLHSRYDWTIEQFRGNIVISGVKAFEEEKWKNVLIKDNKDGVWINLNVNGLCNRCNVISVDQTNGEVIEEPLKTLTKMEGRRFKFGVLASLMDEREDKELSYISSSSEVYLVTET